MDSENKVEAPVPAKDTKGNNKLFGVLAYLGPLVIVSYLVKKDDSFVKFHIKQGLILLAIQIILWVVGSMLMPSLWQLYRLVDLAVVILAIIGIVNVIQDKEKELPLVGKFSEYFSI
jgi:uncharacterized membrane protein